MTDFRAAKRGLCVGRPSIPQLPVKTQEGPDQRYKASPTRRSRSSDFVNRLQLPCWERASGSPERSGCWGSGAEPWP